MVNQKQKLQAFIKISIIFLMISFTILFVCLLAYLYVNEEIYNLITIVLISFLMSIIILTGLLIFTIIRAYKLGKVPQKLIPIMHKAVRPLVAVIIEMLGIFNIDKDVIRGFFVDLNNIIIKSRLDCYTSDQVLILLPHCLQWSECEYKITHNPYNCMKCGKCDIKKILELCEKYHIKVCIATGGTIARKAVKENQPKLVISVACCRDLISGIQDVKNIPVIAIENERPQGPCVNTKVDVKKIKNVLERVIIIREE